MHTKDKRSSLFWTEHLKKFYNPGRWLLKSFSQERERDKWTKGESEWSRERKRYRGADKAKRDKERIRKERKRAET
jgi:hypothetical protein